MNNLIAEMMMTDKGTISERLYIGDFAKFELEELLDDAGINSDKIGWDDYDNSLEIYECDPGFRLSVDMQKAIHSAGFSKVYVNHTDKWETHYSFKSGKDFVEVKGWRVSYPHKREDGKPGIWVEEVVPGWPGEWFETGFAVVKDK